MENPDKLLTQEFQEHEEVVLSEEQEAGSILLQQWMAEFPKVTRPYFVFAGYAGTGKSFTAKTIIKKLGKRPAYMAYTGKAALVLRKYSNVPAQTIHSTIYEVEQLSDEELAKFYDAKKFAQTDAEKQKADLELKEALRPKFKLKEDALKWADIIVLDECSMVNDEILQDLLSLKKPIIALGDPGQLPPIDGTGALFRGLPDAMLTQVRRQAADNPIIQWSMKARNKISLPMSDPSTFMTDRCAKLPYELLARNKTQLAECLLQHDAILVWKNITRRAINRTMRKLYGFSTISPIYPVVGDRIMFTKNDRAMGVFNGQMARVLEVGEESVNSLKYLVEVEGETTHKEVEIFRGCFDVYADPKALDDLHPSVFARYQFADYGYAITVHKAQGSQFERVLVIEENAFIWRDAKETRARWLYTALTRAIEKFTILTGKLNNG